MNTHVQDACDPHCRPIEPIHRNSRPIARLAIRALAAVIRTDLPPTIVAPASSVHLEGVSGDQRHSNS
ncbi:MAG TPA: hypothetical protein VH592_16840 [Gemmataceae bacterium]